MDGLEGDHPFCRIFRGWFRGYKIEFEDERDPEEVEYEGVRAKISH